MLQREMAEFKRTYMQHVNGMREERDMFSNVSLLANLFSSFITIIILIVILLVM